MNKQIVSFTLAGALALGIVGCGQQPTQTTTETTTQTEQTTQKTEQTEVKTNWTSDSDAEAAAKGAGLDKFGVFEKLTFNDTAHQNPKFAHADGVAKATYDGGANELVITKGVNGHKAPLSDRDETTFASKWKTSFDNVDVTLYGPKEGAAVVLTWSDESGNYGVTYQGLGGEEVTLDDQDVTAIVSAVRDANLDQKEDEEEQQRHEQQAEQKQQQKQQNNNSNNNNSNNNNNSGNNDGSGDNNGMNDNYGADGCIQIACDYAGAGGQAKGPALNLSCSGLINGGGTLYYVVDFDLGDVHYQVQVDAIDGNVISGVQTFNGTQQLLDDEGNPIENTEEPAE